MKRIVPRIVVAMGIAGFFAGSGSPAHAADAVPRAGAGGGKKLLVFILAGQSNMQGQAAASTLAYLPKPPYVPTKEEWLTLTNWLERDLKGAEGDEIKSPLEQARAWEEGLRTPIGKRAYIAAGGGVRRGDEEGFAAGPLSIGYGARSTTIGPEYAFGIMMEKALDQPVLIIKTSWGGKSLHYDFRAHHSFPFSHWQHSAVCARLPPARLKRPAPTSSSS